MRGLCIVALLLAFAFGSEVRMPLFVQKPGQTERLPFATLIYDEELSSVNVTDINESLQEDSYCFGAHMNENYYSCFSYVRLRYPLHYDLYLDTKHNTHLLYKLSLKPNPKADGIQTSIREPQQGPESPPVKLRRITKTYEDKRSKLGSASAAFEEDVEVDERTFLQKNWKYMLIGLVLYAVIMSGNSQ
ncbi:LANO_0E07184g1_1 [Lachancea nothofagi CBS 11611]|uniref:LANO_0E07184g1_1 n=1 Tax=Lachancea nothofagi CBS 11611 TaxID=1266666 RepID=A0A1G4JUD3_9SACH|nr:LANO_0E07184g1_1 [Lachancea nothofagi CBS 11611]